MTRAYGRKREIDKCDVCFLVLCSMGTCTNLETVHDLVTIKDLFRNIGRKM